MKLKADSFLKRNQIDKPYPGSSRKGEGTQIFKIRNERRNYSGQLKNTKYHETTTSNSTAIK